MNEVALGECKDYYEHQPDLKAPPEGYHSTHGVRAQQGLQSAFKVSRILHVMYSLPRSV